MLASRDFEVRELPAASTSIQLMQKPLTDEELWELEDMDDRGEFDPPPPRKKRPSKPENLKFDF